MDERRGKKKASGGRQEEGRDRRVGREGEEKDRWEGEKFGRTGEREEV